MPVWSAVWLIVSRSWVLVRRVGGQKKTPHAGGVAVLSDRVRSARPGKKEPAGHVPSLARTPGGPPDPHAGGTRPRRRAHPMEGDVRGRVAIRPDPADPEFVSTGSPPRRPNASRALLIATGALVAAWATGLVLRPAGLGWDRFYDVALFNAPWLTAAALAWRAAGRVPRERGAWRCISAALALIASANVVRTLAVGATGAGTAPALADTLAVLGYPLVWV